MKRYKRLIPQHSKRVRLLNTNKYGLLVEFNCHKSFIKWDGTDRIVKVLNCKLEFLPN